MSAVVSDARTATRPGWWDRPFQTFQTNLREIDADLDVERTLDAVQAHGCDTWLLNTGGILSWYPTELAFQERNPHLADRPGGDLVGDAVTAARARGVRVLARMDFSKVVPRIADEHPEWCFVGPDGDRQVFEGLVSVCPSGGYYQDHLLRVLDEVIDRYGVDGFFCNWFGFNEVDYAGRYHGVCHCAACAQAYRREVGEELPRGRTSSGYERWTRFAAGVVSDLTRRIREHVADRRPEAALIQGLTSDILFHEANNAVGRPLWPHATEEAVSALRSARPDAPVFVNAVAFVDMPYRMAAEQPEHLEHYLVQAIARGANPSTYIMGPPERIDYAGLPAAARVTRFHAAHADLYAELTPAARVALVRPAGAGRHPSAEHVGEFRGAYSALLERHVPFDVVSADALADSDGGLARWRVLVLPHVGPVGERVAATLDAWVAAGGRLLLTGSSAMAATDDGTWRAEPASAPLAVATAVQQGRELLSTYTTAVGGGLLPVHGSLLVGTGRRDGTTVQERLLPAAGYGPPEKAYGHQVSTLASRLRRRHGEGTVTQIPWTIGRAYGELGTTVIRDELVDAVLDGVDDTAVDASALPEQVEVVIGTAGDSLVLHLLNFSGVRRSTFGPPVSVGGGRVRVRGAAGSSARALVADEPCQTADDAHDLLIDLPTISTFEVVLVERP